MFLLSVKDAQYLVMWLYKAIPDITGLYLLSNITKKFDKLTYLTVSNNITGILFFQIIRFNIQLKDSSVLLQSISSLYLNDTFGRLWLSCKQRIF
jgi:hypothetical protein